MKGIIIAALLFCASSFAQTFSPVQPVDFSNTTTKTVQVGIFSALPPTCSVGQQYFASDAVAGQNLLTCTSANVWLTNTSIVTPLWTLDANINTGAKIGGGTATDNTVVINTWLQQASLTGNAILNVPGGSVTSGIVIPQTNGNVTIYGCGLGCGFFTKSGTDTFGISTADSVSPPRIPFDPGQFPPYNSTPSVTNSGSVIIKDLFLNANGGFGDACLGVVSCTLSTPYTGGKDKGYMSLGPPLCPATTPCTTAIGTTAFPSSPVAKQWVKITNGGTATDCSLRNGSYVVFCFWTGSQWYADGAGSQGSYPWFTGIDLSNRNYVKVDNVRILNSPSYAMRLMNVNTVELQNVICDQNPAPSNTNHDCIHVSGPASNVVVRGGVMTNSDDDNIAFNANEGYGGAISNAIVDGTQFVNANDWVNIDGNVISVLLTNLQGTLYGTAVRIPGSGTGDVLLSNSTMTFVPGGAGSVISAGGSSVNKISLANVNVISPQAGNVGDIICGSGETISEIDIHGLTQTLNAAGAASGPFLSINTGCHVKKVIWDGTSVNSSSGAYGMNYALSVSGTLDELEIDSINFDYVNGLVDSTNNWTHINKVTGQGLASLVYGVPDAIVVNNTLYRSATCMATYSATSSCIAIKLGSAGSVVGTPWYFGMQNGPNGAANPALVVSSGSGASASMIAVGGEGARFRADSGQLCQGTAGSCNVVVASGGATMTASATNTASLQVGPVNTGLTVANFNTNYPCDGTHGYLGRSMQVVDATSGTPGSGTAVGGGTFQINVECIYSGSAFSWIIH